MSSGQKATARPHFRDPNSHLLVTPVRAEIGAVISGVDLTSPLTAGEVAEIRKALQSCHVVFFRGQFVSAEDQVRLARCFGRPHVYATEEYGQTQLPEIIHVSNCVKGGHLGSGELSWHTDSSFYPNPPTFTFLFAEEVPPEGGDTFWANMAAAYDAFPEGLKRRLEGLSILHDNKYNISGKERVLLETAKSLGQKVPDGAIHPIVRVHPESGRKTAYIGRVAKNRIVGLSENESEEILRTVETLSTRVQFVVRHQWRPNDLAIWDNRSSMHRRDAFSGELRRVMRRCQVYDLKSI